jgi:hypothetical protein
VQLRFFVRPGPLLVNKGDCRGYLVKVNLTFDSDSLLISCTEYYYFVAFARALLLVGPRKLPPPNVPSAANRTLLSSTNNYFLFIN